MSVSDVAISAVHFGEPFALPAQKSRLVEDRVGASEARLRLLMAAHFDFVWRSLRRLGLQGPDADDGAQEVFLVASRKLSQIEAGRERNFLFSTAVRVASTRRRSVKRRREEPLLNLDDQERSEPGPERLTEMSRARRELQEILDGMVWEQRLPFILFELEEQTVPEIAGTLGLPIGTVSSRLRAAREHFQASLRRLHARDAFPKARP
jgi:RNA polymerase sigma-70 factor (ECF subfamily)